MFCPRRAVTLLVSVTALALAAPAGAQTADCPGADVVPAAGNTPLAAQATLCLLNGERAAQGMGALSEAPGLTQPSIAYSNRMVTEHFFAHESPDGGRLTDRLTAAGYIEANGDWTVGENIAWGQGELSTPRSIVAAWMASPGHRDNILTRKYTEIGLGIALGTPGDTAWGATYTTDFGAVQRDTPAASPRTAAATPVAKRTAAAAAKSTTPAVKGATPAAKRCKSGGRSARGIAARKAARGNAKKAAAACGRAASTRRTAR
jgi:uncharacterized protein YkwD